jgi:hypothetical protein
MDQAAPLEEVKQNDELDQTAKKAVDEPETMGNHSLGGSTPAQQKPAPSWFYKFSNFLFSPYTRFGRFMRPFIRGAALVVGFFALGVIATYLILYQPTAQQLAGVRSELQNAGQKITQLQATNTNIQKDLVDLQEQFSRSQADLKRGNIRIGLLQMASQVTLARLALVNRDGAGAQKALSEARAILNTVLVDLKARDVNAATQLDSRMTLVISELNDPATAQADLTLLSAKLTEMDVSLKSQ